MALDLLFVLVKKYNWKICEIFICIHQSRFFICYPRKISKNHNITSKHFCIINKTPSTSWVTHIRRNFLTCYSCLYYSSMLALTFLLKFLRKYYLEKVRLLGPMKDVQEVQTKVEWLYGQKLMTPNVTFQGVISIETKTYWFAYVPFKILRAGSVLG